MAKGNNQKSANGCTLDFETQPWAVAEQAVPDTESSTIKKLTRMNLANLGPRDADTREVNAKGETIWEFNCNTDLPAEYQFTSAPQSRRGWPTATPSSPRAPKIAKAPNSLK
jgi:hypothetical protein